MSGNGAYEDEMGFLRGLSFEDEDVAGFALALRASLRRGPDPGLSATMIPRLAQVARTASHSPAAAVGTASPAEAGPPRRHRLAPVGRIAIAVALLPLLTAGMAVAGVRLPDAAVSAFDAVGVELPNQAESSDGGVSGDEGAGAKSGAGQGVGGGEGDVGNRNGKAGDKGQGNDPPSAGGQGQGKRQGNGPPAHSNAGGNGGGSANAHGGNPNAKGGNPNAGGGNPNAGGGNPNSGGANSNRPSSPPGQGGGQGSSGGQGAGKN